MAREKFDISRNQKIGLASVCTILLVFLLFTEAKSKGKFNDPFDVDSSQLTYFEEEQTELAEQEYQYSTSNDKVEVQLFDFDPNELDEVGFENLGFSGKQSQSIIKFRENYGDFESKADFKKLYVISDEKFAQLEPYIQLDLETAPIQKMEVNLATAEDLQNIKGIGPSYSKRIIELRDLLGGYNSAEQFTEVYGLEEETVDLLKTNLLINPELINRLNVNSASKKEMKRHPYFGFEIIAMILDERDQAKIENLDFLNNKIDSDRIQKITPYVSFE